MNYKKLLILNIILTVSVLFWLNKGIMLLNSQDKSLELNQEVKITYGIINLGYRSISYIDYYFNWDELLHVYKKINGQYIEIRPDPYSLRKDWYDIFSVKKRIFPFFYDSEKTIISYKKDFTDKFNNKWFGEYLYIKDYEYIYAIDNLNEIYLRVIFDAGTMYERTYYSIPYPDGFEPKTYWDGKFFMSRFIQLKIVRK